MREMDSRVVELDDSQHYGMVLDPPEADPPWLVGEHVRISGRTHTIRAVSDRGHLVVERMSFARA